MQSIWIISFTFSNPSYSFIPIYCHECIIFSILVNNVNYFRFHKKFKQMRWISNYFDNRPTKNLQGQSISIVMQYWYKLITVIKKNNNECPHMSFYCKHLVVIYDHSLYSTHYTLITFLHWLKTFCNLHKNVRSVPAQYGKSRAAPIMKFIDNKFYTAPLM